MARSERESDLPEDLVAIVSRETTLCLNVDDPGWDDARGYSFDEAAATLYFTVAKQYLPADPALFRVLIWSQPRVLVSGELRTATSDEDVRIQFALAEERGFQTDEARYMLLDQRTKKPRKTLYKLIARELSLAGD